MSNTYDNDQFADAEAAGFNPYGYRPQVLPEVQAAVDAYRKRQADNTEWNVPDTLPEGW
jgi:hypothetical protein